MSPIFQFPRDAARHPDEIAYLVARVTYAAAFLRAERIYASRWRRFCFGPPTKNHSTRAQRLLNVRPDYHRAFAAEDRALTAMVAARRKWLGEEANN